MNDDREVNEVNEVNEDRGRKKILVWSMTIVILVVVCVVSWFIWGGSSGGGGEKGPQPISPGYQTISNREWLAIIDKPQDHVGLKIVIYGADSRPGPELNGKVTVRAYADGVRHNNEFDYPTLVTLTGSSGSEGEGEGDGVSIGQLAADRFKAEVTVLGIDGPVTGVVIPLLRVDRLIS